MPTYPLPHRIQDYLRRQIAWSQVVLAELEAFCGTPEDADFDAVLARQQRWARESRDLSREYRGLAREWADAPEVSPEDRAAIRQLSAEVDTLLEQVREGYRRAGAEAEARQAANQQAMRDLRRGRRSVNIYRPGLPVRPDFIDRKA